MNSVYVNFQDSKILVTLIFHDHFHYYEMFRDSFCFT